LNNLWKTGGGGTGTGTGKPISSSSSSVRFRVAHKVGRVAVGRQAVEGVN